MRWGRHVSSVSRCIGLEDVNSSMEKEKEKNSGEGKQLGKFAPNQGKENRRELSKRSLGIWTVEVVADRM